MIIKDSTISMSSAREYQGYSHSVTESRETNNQSVVATLDLSENGKFFSMHEFDQKIKESEKEDIARRKQQSADNLTRMLKEQQARQAKNNSEPVKVDDEDGLIRVLKQILAALRGEKFDSGDWPSRVDNSILRQQRMAMSFSQQMEFSIGITGSTLDFRTGTAGNASGGFPGIGGNIWTNITATTTTAWEKEDTVFSSVGTAHTADGREINFNVELAMSRSFAGIFKNVSLSTERRICTDPLVINVDSDVTHISDKKYRFDLNCDGKADEISWATGGSGFLALDRNGDGRINDGSELFGARTGDGFAELSVYDSDGNGWIDEADDVFSKLLIWKKDENGNDSLISLKDADVGAIFLGNTSTEFSLNDSNNVTQGVIRKTGIFLKESGDVGTISHVDLAI